MILRSLELLRFRNYSNERVQFDDQRNIFCGRNAQGKSNILEAIYVLCISRSFRTRFEKEAIQFKEHDCSVRGEFVLDNGRTRNVVFYYNRKEGKQVSIDRNRITRMSDYIGQFPVVLSSPEEYDLTSGPPASRRRFMDILFSQLSTSYLHDLQDYLQVLKQRNAILNDAKYNRRNVSAIIEPWNDSLVEKGSRIIWNRLAFSDQINTLVESIYSKLSDSGERLNFSYGNFAGISEFEELKKAFIERLLSNYQQEIERGKTLTGPHRDDYIFTIDGKDLRKYGSRGQHKTVLIALMIAEYKMIKEKKKETPLILVDDLFSELDRTREEKIIQYLQNMGQNFLTTTLPVKESIHYTGMNNITHFEVKNGLLEKSL